MRFCIYFKQWLMEDMRNVDKIGLIDIYSSSMPYKYIVNIEGGNSSFLPKLNFIQKQKEAL